MSKRKSKRWLLLLAGVLGLLAVFGWTDARRLLVPAAVARIEGKAVQRGPLRISVVERGNLKAADSATLRCELERTTTIIYLIDEGTHVQPGDLLCELDSAELVQRRVEQEISVQNREAAYVKAKQSYAIQKSENDSAIATAERALEFAQMDLRKYLDGEYPQELQQRDEDIVLAEEELKRAAQNLEWSEKLAEKGFLEQTQLDADRLAEKRAEIQVAQRRRAKELLTDYEYPRQLRELEANVDEARRELDRERLQAEARIVDFAANERTSKAQLDLEREELRKIDSQLAKARIYAPVAGMVVYAVEEGGGRFSDSEPIQEGSTVREREAIITIPTANDMIAEASLHESVLEKVKTGMPCVITVDAVPGRTYRGQVAYKALLPDQGSFWANPDLRVYRTQVRVLDAEDRIRPGMSCSIEIVVETLADALYIPLQSIFLDQGATVCFVSEGGDVDKRPIEVGENNGRWAHVLDGLEEGEIVLLSKPAGFSVAPALEEEPELDPSREDFPMPGGPGLESGDRGLQPGGPAADAGAPGGRSAEGGERARAWRGGAREGGQGGQGGRTGGGERRGGRPSGQEGQ